MTMNSVHMKTSYRLIRTCTVFLALFMNIFQSFSIDLVTGHTSSPLAEVNHSPAQEKDPCHRSIYHQDDVHGCHHRAHILPVKEGPNFYRLARHSDYVVPGTAIYLQSVIPFCPKDTLPLPLLEKGISIRHGSRAPPVR